MEQVLAIPELVDLITEGESIDEIKMIAKLRMVNKFTRDLFATVVGAETKTRCGFTRTATTYTVRKIYGREPFYSSPRCVGFLRSIQLFPRSRLLGGILAPALCRSLNMDSMDKCSIGCEHADVIHVKSERGDSIETGFNTDKDLFVAINRLFGLKSAAYGVLLEQRWCGSSGYADVMVTHDNITIAKVDSGAYALMRNIYVTFEYTAYYMFYGQIHGCDKDIGDFNNLTRLGRITW